MTNRKFISIIYSFDSKKELLHTAYTLSELLQDIVTGFISYAKDTKTGEVIYDSETQTVNGAYFLRGYAEPWTKKARPSDTTESNA